MNPREAQRYRAMMMGDQSTKAFVVGAAIALLVFVTVPLAQLAGRHRAAGTAGTGGQTIADRIGGAVTNVVETHTRMSVALSGVTR